MIGRSIWRWGWLVVGLIVALSFLQFSSAPASARQGAGGAQCACVAVLDPAVVFENLQETGSRQAELNQFIADRENEIKSITDELKEIQEELETTGAVLSPSDPEFIALRNRAFRTDRRYRFESEFATRQIEERQVQIQLEVFNKIKAAAARYAQREGIDLVLSDDSSVELRNFRSINEFNAAISTRRVLYANDGISITDAVTQMMNNEFAAASGN